MSRRSAVFKIADMGAFRFFKLMAPLQSGNFVPSSMHGQALFSLPWYLRVMGQTIDQWDRVKVDGNMTQVARPLAEDLLALSKEAELDLAKRTLSSVDIVSTWQASISEP
jgi:hypothetical protein